MNCSIIVLACPPVQLKPVASAVRPMLRLRHVLISMAAGVNERKLSSMFGVNFVLRTAVVRNRRAYAVSIAFIVYDRSFICVPVFPGCHIFASRVERRGATGGHFLCLRDFCA